VLSIPSGSKKTPEGLSDGDPIVLQDVKSIDFEHFLWMFYNELNFLTLLQSPFLLRVLIKSCAHRSYTDHTASAEKWASIISLADKWQFETMSGAAFRAYIALQDVEAVDKIAMGQMYDFPREDLLEVYFEICTRTKPLSVEEGRKVGCDTLARIALTREEMKLWNSPDTKKQTVTNNIIKQQPTRYPW
jgi:hypothetical protein